MVFTIIMEWIGCLAETLF